MATAGGPNIITDGLVFGYDTGHGISDNDTATRFYKGEPTSNLLQSTTIERSGDGSTYSYYGENIDSLVQSQWSSSNNKLTLSFEGKRDYVGGGTGGGNDGYPRFYIYFTDWSWASSVATDAYDWTKVHQIATMPDPTGKSVRFNIYHMNNTNPGRSYSRNHQIEFKPRKTPFILGDRSSTDSLIDLKKSTNIDLSNVSFDSTGQPEFDGTDDSISLPNPGTSNSQGFTIELVIKPNSYSNSPMIITPISHGIDHYVRINSSGKIGMTTILAADSSSRTHATTSTVTTGEYHHITFTYDSDTGGKVYYNNDLEYSVAPDWVAKDWEGTWMIGQRGNSTYFFNGSLPVLKVYNKVLGQAEITQNFNAYKNRFDI